MSVARERAGADHKAGPIPERGLLVRIRSWHDRLMAGDPEKVAAVSHEMQLCASSLESCPENVIDAIVGARAALKDGDLQEARRMLDIAAKRAGRVGEN